jgi:hypothetical protein
MAVFPFEFNPIVDMMQGKMQTENCSAGAIPRWHVILAPFKNDGEKSWPLLI